MVEKMGTGYTDTDIRVSGIRQQMGILSEYA